MQKGIISVNIRFLCRDITGNIESGIYTVEKGATVAELFALCEEQYNKKIDEELKDRIIFLIDGKEVSWDYVLSDGQKINAVRPVFGG